MTPMQLDIFGNVTKATNKIDKNDYDSFVKKFEKKKTTDDCITPPAVYEAVLDWCKERYHISPATRIVRPFWPGGDFENEDYSGDCIVIDNPPFSIISKICRWFTERGVRFFLFAPYLTSMGIANFATVIVAPETITYENGALVNTSFVTNMEGSTLARTAPDLMKILKEANKRSRPSKKLPKYKYPDQVLTIPMIGYLANHGIEYKIDRADVCNKIIQELDSQKAAHKRIFGGGVLISSKAAAEKAAAEKAAAEKAAAEKAGAILWELSDRERAIIAELDNQ